LLFAINEGKKLQHPIQVAQSNVRQRGFPAKPPAPNRKFDLFASQFRNYSSISTAKKFVTAVVLSYYVSPQHLNSSTNTQDATNMAFFPDV